MNIVQIVSSSYLYYKRKYLRSFRNRLVTEMNRISRCIFYIVYIYAFTKEQLLNVSLLIDNISSFMACYIYPFSLIIIPFLFLFNLFPYLTLAYCDAPCLKLKRRRSNEIMSETKIRTKNFHSPALGVDFFQVSFLNDSRRNRK